MSYFLELSQMIFLSFWMPFSLVPSMDFSVLTTKYISFLSSFAFFSFWATLGMLRG